jgi:hypothetical protein
MLAAIFHLNLQRSRAGRASPQDRCMDGTGLRFETMENCGEYPDTMPQAIKLIDATAAPAFTCQSRKLGRSSIAKVICWIWRMNDHQFLP